MNEKFDIEIYLDKATYKLVFAVGGALLIIALGCTIWGYANYDEYSETVKTVSGRVRDRGLGPTLFGWGIGFSIAIPIMYGLMWMSLDFKNPALAVNKNGFFINKEFFKNTFIRWEEFADINMNNGFLNLVMKDAEAIVNRQKGIGKAFLKQSYVKDNSPITIDPNESSQHKELVEAVIKYSSEG